MQTFRLTKFTQWTSTEWGLPRVFYGGGKTQQSTSQVSIPPEILANYQNVNSIANQVAQTPFQQYSTDPNAFVAPLTPTQQAGILATNQYAGEAQPFYQTASNQNEGATQAGQGLISGAAGLSQNSTQAGQGLISGAAGLNQNATQAGQGLISGAAGLSQNATQAGQGFISGAAGLSQNATNTGLAGLNAARNSTGAAAAPITSQQIQNYENPYESQVINPVNQLLQQQFNQAQSGQLGNAIQNGAFGGDRAAVSAANLQQQQSLAMGQTDSGLLNQNYSQALGEANTEQQAGLQGANQLGQLSSAYGSLGQANANNQAQYGSAYGELGQANANNRAQYGSAYGSLGQAGANNQAQYGSAYGSLGQANANNQAQYGSAYGSLGQAGATNEANIGSGAQAAGLAGGQAQLTAGQAQQQTEQAGLTALYNQFLQQQSYPFQTTQFQSNIAEGTGALSGSTTSSTQPAPYFSDERLKEEIQPIGKTFDGLNIIKFKYKGDNQTHVGLSAQDVEKHHPEAVGLAGGYKTVDYDAATKKAADRGRDADSSGGLVVPHLDRRKYDVGGYAGLSPNAAWSAGFNLDPSYLQAQEAAYGSAPWGNAGPVSGAAPYGGKSHVPPSTGSPHAALAVAHPPQGQAQNGLQQLASSVNQIEGLGKTGKSLYNDAKGAMPGLAAGTSPPSAPASQMPPGRLPPSSGTGSPIAPAADPSMGRANAQQLAGLDPNAVGSPDMSGLGDDLGSMFSRRGGRIQRDSGGATYQDAASDDQSAGGDVPYDSGTGAGGLDIPDDKPHNSLATSQPPSSTSGGGLGDAIGTAGKLAADVLPFFLAKGGRVGLAGGGDPGDMPPLDDPSTFSAQGSPGLDVPAIQGALRAKVAPESAPRSASPAPKILARPATTGLNPDVPSPDASPVQAVQDMGSGQHLTQPGEVLTQDNPGGVGDFLNRNQGLLVPALHGLGTMASSNSRYLGSAILQGLGGAADSYENTQNEMQGRSGNQPIIQQRQNDAMQSDLGLWQSYIAQNPGASSLTFPQFEQLKQSGRLNSYQGQAQRPMGGAGQGYNYTIQEKNTGTNAQGVPLSRDPAYLKAFSAKNNGVQSPMVAGQVQQANHDASEIQGQGYTMDAQGNRVPVQGYESTALAQNHPAVLASQAADFQNQGVNFMKEYGRSMSLFDELGDVYHQFQAGPTADWRASVSRLANEFDPSGQYPFLHNIPAGNDAANYDKARKDIAQLTASQLNGMPESERQKVQRRTCWVILPLIRTYRQMLLGIS